jgi:hypothetical protein
VVVVPVLSALACLSAGAGDTRWRVISSPTAAGGIKAQVLIDLDDAFANVLVEHAWMEENR